MKIKIKYYILLILICNESSSNDELEEILEDIFKDLFDNFNNLIQLIFR